MTLNYKIELIYMARILIAGICGVAIGYERESHLKFAGIRTHAIVAIAASLMMVISKYGFYDVLNAVNISLDPSRVAAGIVTAIGFLGAGVIFVRKKTINGLTTGAGIWATVGVGMAVGAGMYLIGAATTVIIVIIQTLLNKKARLLRIPAVKQVDVTLNNPDMALPLLMKQMKAKKIEIINMQSKRKEEEILLLRLFLKLPGGYDASELLMLLKENADVLTIEI